MNKLYLLLLFFGILTVQVYPRNKNILFDKNIWRSQEWARLVNPFDTSNILVSRYGGSEIRFNLQNSSSLKLSATSSNHAFDQGVRVYINGEAYEVETPNIDSKPLQIDLKKFADSTRMEIVIRHHCAGSTHPCDIALRELIVDRHAVVTSPDIHPEETVAFLGDSISVGFSEENYTYKFAEKLGMLLHNASVFGSRVWQNPAWDSATRRLHKDIIAFNPEVIIVALGTNDLSDGVSQQDFQRDYSQLITQIRRGTPNSKVVALGLFKRKDISEFKVMQFSRIVATVSQENNILFIDPYNWLTEEDLMDNVHPSIESQKKLADKLYDALSPLLTR